MINFSPEEKDFLLEQIIIWVCEAKGKAATKDLIIETVPQLSEDDANILIKEAVERLAARQEKDPVVIIGEHVSNYEKIYAYFKSIDHASGANKALKAKERLLDILKHNKVVLKRSETVVHAAPKPLVEYDLTKLSPEKQQRLKYLLAKAGEAE